MGKKLSKDKNAKNVNFIFRMLNNGIINCCDSYEKKINCDPSVLKGIPIESAIILFS